MALNFPNPMRRYDSVRDCVCFWGSDASLEVAFQVDAVSLRRISAHARSDEASLLEAFDDNRGRIQQVATKAYGKRRQSFCQLSSSDF